MRVLGLPHCTVTRVGVSDLPGAAGDGNEVDVSDVMDSDTSPDNPAELDIDELL